jgi:hypothetical protein
MSHAKDVIFSAPVAEKREEEKKRDNKPNDEPENHALLK